MKNNNEGKIIDAISKAYSDPEIKKDSEFSQALFDYAKKISDGDDYRLVCVKLSRKINSYLMANKFKSPQTLTDLNAIVGKEVANYRGASSVSMWGSNLF